MSRVTTDAIPPVGIAILAKAPLPGLAKTRLIPRLGAAGAASLQRWLLRRTVKTALDANIGPVNLWGTPDARHPDFDACLAYGPITLRQQPEADLGTRIHAALLASPAPGGCLVIGTDCAVLTADILRQAAATLQRKPAVLTPAEDGGYVLMGLRKPCMPVFSQVDWGTSYVLEQTRRHLLMQELEWAELPTLWDIDRPEDYERLLVLHPELAMQVSGVEA